MISGSDKADWGSLMLHGIRETGKEIGVGAYGRVFEVSHEGTLCAAKEVHALLLQYAQGDTLKKIKDNFLNECQIWSTLRHPCVVQFLGVYYPAVDQYRLPVMVMEKMQHSLRGLVEKYDSIPFNVKLSILDEVCLGLRYLHSRNPPIVHRDLTPNNILLSYRLEAKITDLGVAKVMKTEKQKTMTKLPGTPDFMPPEALSVRPVYGPSLDVFSYGGVILNVTTQLWPQPTDPIEFNPDTGKREVVSEVKRRQEYLDKMIRDARDLKPLVMSCLDDNPINRTRPSIAQVSVTIKRVKDICSEKNSRDGMSPIVWWAEVSNEQQSQVTSSQTTALEKITINNEQLRRENSILKSENTQLRANVDLLKSENDAMKNKISQLKTEVEMMKAKNAIENNDLKACHFGTITSQQSPAIPQKKQQLKQSTTPRDLFSGPVNIKWEEGAPAPVNFAGHSAVWLNGLIYVGGGNENERRGLYAIHRYDPLDNLWSLPINTPYTSFAMTTLNNRLLIAGGWDKSGKTTNQILTLDAGQLKNYTKMTIARSYATATGHEGMLVIVGGIDFREKVLSSTELFNSHTRQWCICNNLPIPHFWMKSVVIDDVLYLLGGYINEKDSSSAVFTAQLDSLSRHELTWKPQQNTPWCWSAPVNNIQGKHLLLVGGIYINKIGQSILSSHVFKLSKISHAWEIIGHTPFTIESSAAVSTDDNRIILVGGMNEKGKCINTVWIGSCEPQ